MISIPNYLLSRQGKSLDYEWVSILDVVVFNAPHWPFKRRTRPEQYHLEECKGPSTSGGLKKARIKAFAN